MDKFSRMKHSKIFYVFLAVIYSMAGMYNFDWPQSLETQLQLPPYNYSLQQINLIYIVTTVPVIFVCTKLGMVFDRIHHSISFLVIPMLMFVAQLGCTISTIFEGRYVYYLILFFRAFCGIAIQSYYILVSIFLTKIYGEEAGLLIGFTVIFIYTADPLNSIITPELFALFHKVFIPLFVGVGVSCISIVAGIFKIRILNRLQQKSNIGPEDIQQNLVQTNLNEKYQQKTIIQLLKSFNLAYWLLMIILFFNISAISTFVSLGNDYLVKRFQIQYVTSGQLMMLPYLVGALSSFFWNWLVTNHPKQRRNLIFSICLLVLLSHLTFYLTHNTQNTPIQITKYLIIIIGLVILGISFGGLAMISIASINLVVDQTQIGGAYGFSIVVGNLPFCYATYLSAFIVQKANTTAIGYFNISYLYLGISILGLIVSIILVFQKDAYSLKLDSETTQDDGMEHK